MRIKFAVLLVLSLSLFACQIDKAALRDVVAAATAPSQAETSNGIKGALEQGVVTSLASLGRKGGFASDARVRIPLPEQLTKVDSLLRKIGQEKYADEFVDTLNVAAEKATPVAKDVFLGAIKRMSITDAIGIIKGPQNSATDYFKRTTNEELTSRFKPIVNKATGSAGVTKSYKSMVDKLALVGYKPKVQDLDAYVTDKALDGVYLYIAEQEKSIRENPGLAVSNIVRKVFSYYK